MLTLICLAFFLLSPSPEHLFDTWYTEVVHHHRDEHDGINNFVTKPITIQKIYDFTCRTFACYYRNWYHSESENNRKNKIEKRRNENGNEPINCHANQKIKSFSEHDSSSRPS